MESMPGILGEVRFNQEPAARLFRARDSNRPVTGKNGKPPFNVEVTGAARLYRAASVLTAGLDLSFRAMTYGLNSVAKRILKECPEVVAVVLRTEAWRSIIFPAIG